MAESLFDQATKAAIEKVKAEKPSQFTVGGHYDGTRIVGGITYDRKLSNLFGITAYARAYWDDLPVTTHTPKKPRVQIGGEATYRF